MKNCMMIYMFLFILFSVSASPAMAGQVTIVNKTQSWNCFLRADGYFLGSGTTMYTPCALPGKTEWFHTSLSTGILIPYCVYEGTSTNRNACTVFDADYQNHQTQSKEYKIGGTWLPHRNFTVTVSGDSSRSAFGGGGLNFELTEN